MSVNRASSGELDYESRTAARLLVTKRDADVTRITVPMHVLYVPVPRWVGDLDFLALMVGPLWWIATLIVRTCLRLPNPPRAVFEVSSESVKMTLRDPAYGTVTVSVWPRAAILEMRANRYESGLWVAVEKHVKETFLTDLPCSVVEKLGAELNTALHLP